MPTIYPTDVLAILVRDYPWVQKLSQAPTFFDAANDAHKVAALVDLLEQIPASLLVQSRDDFSAYRQTTASLRQLLKQSERGGSIYWPSIGGGNVLTTLWLLLQKCPDEAISEVTGGLEFIADTPLRESIRRDVSAADSALNNGGWKASTVIAGAAVEALLLWAIASTTREEREDAISKASGRVPPFKSLDADRPEDWHLSAYIEVALELGKISRQAAEQARLAKDYRNLIHPGREMREKVSCDRGTAHGAFAAVQLVVRDLSQLT
jgi:hypothetical protein